MRHHVRICGFTAIIYLCFVFFAHANQNVISSYSCPSILDGIPDQVINTGKIFQYKIPERAFRMSEDAVIRISTASEDSNLPEWISYNPESREILAVPTVHDGYGIYLKVTVEDPRSSCENVFDVFHIAITSWSPDKQTLKHSSKEQANTKKTKVCRGVDLIQTTLIFAVNLKELWAPQRWGLVTNLARFLGVDSSMITVSTGNELFSTQDNTKSYSILASGHGNTVSIVPNATELTWQVPCSVFPEVHLFVQVLQHNVEGGRLTAEVGFNVVGWYISALVNPSKQQQGRKKRFAQRFMTPVPTPVPDLVPATKVRQSVVPEIVPSTTVTSTSSSSSSSKSWWWWPDSKEEETKTKSSSSIEQTTSEFSLTDKMTKPFPSESEIIEHTLTQSSHSSRISPTKSSYFTPSPAATPHTKLPSSSFPETTTIYHVESPFSSESPPSPSSSSSSSLMTSQTSVPEMTRSSTDYYTKTDVLSTRTTIPEEDKSYSELDGISGSGDSTYTDEDSLPVIETTVLPSTETSPPISLFITPSSPIKKPSTEEEDGHSVTDMPYAGSGSGSGGDEEETPVIIQPSSHAASESLFIPTPSLSSAIDSSETNIFYFEETASMSSSKRISPSIYIPSWDTDLFTSSSSSSSEVWITKNPYASKDKEHTLHSGVTESSMDPYPDTGSSKKEDSTDAWSSKETGHSTNVWYTKKEQSTDVWSSRETGHSTVTVQSREPEEFTTAGYTWGGLWPKETERTKETLHTSSSTHYDEEITSSETTGTHATLPPHYSTASQTPTPSSMELPPYSHPSSVDIKSSISPEIKKGEISPSTGSYIPTTSTVGSIYIEEELVTKHGEMPSKYDSTPSSKMPDRSSVIVSKPSTIPDDCTWGCTTGATLEASSTQIYGRPTPTRSSSTTESTSVTPVSESPMIPVTVPTQKKQRTTTTPQPTTEQKRVTKKPKKRPTLPPIPKTTDYINKAPRVRAPIGNVYAAIGTVFKFQIPKNTFYDPEDGNTRRLTLNVPRRPPTNANSWLEFDETTQTLTGLPLEQEVKQSPMKVTINAIDKGGRLAQDVIRIHVNSTAIDQIPAYEFVMKFEVNGKKFLAERKHLRNLMKKLSSFFGDRDSSSITILDARPGSLILTWTNNSIPTDRCDNETVHEQKRKIFDDNNRLNPKFRKYMSPRFTVLSAEFNLDGACLDTDPGTLGGAETGDIAEVNPWAEAIIPTVIAVAIAIFIVVIILLICSRKQRQKKKQKKSDQRNSFEDQDPVMFHSERSLANSDRGMRSKRAVILPGDVNTNSSLNRNFSPYQASGFGEPDNVSEYDEVESETGNYTYNNGTANPPPPYRLPPPYYPENGSSYV